MFNHVNNEYLTQTLLIYLTLLIIFNKFLCSNISLKLRYRTFPGHGQEVCGLVWSNDGHYLASGGGDNLVKIWEPSMLTTEDPVRFPVV